jgi:signal transduction histidine kinase
LNWVLTQKNVLPHQLREIQLTGIVDEVFMTLGRLAEDKSIHLVSEIADDTMIMADRNALLAIVRNLVDNTIKFTPENGYITITSKPSDVGVDISIKDTGVGIDAEKSKTIFLLRKGKSIQGIAGEKGTRLGFPFDWI